MSIRTWLRPSVLDLAHLHIVGDFRGYRGQVWTLALVVGMKAFGLSVVLAAGTHSVSGMQRIITIALIVLEAILLIRPLRIPNWYLHFTVTAMAIANYALLVTAQMRGLYVGTMLTSVVLVIYTSVWFPLRQAAVQSGAILGLAWAGLVARWDIVDVLAMWLPTAGTAVLLSIVARALILRIQQLATHDELTAALNRGGLQAVIRKSPTTAPGQTHALVVIDLDDFKRINDEQGHHAGDAVLRAVTDGLRANTRPDDAIVRSGGDEFLLVLPYTDGATAQGVIERLRPQLPIGFSCGIATWTGAHDFDAAHVQADAAMYLEKASRSRRQN